MIDYNALRDEIINTLVGRPNGTQIMPENHQHYSLNMLDYIREIELVMQSSLMGFAKTSTIPHQPDDARVSYVGAVAPNTTSVYSNFYDSHGNAITITSNTNEGLLVIFIWNMEFWSYETVPAGQATYYGYNIRKTYTSLAAMNADVNAPIATDNTPIVIGELVSVVNPNNSTENGIYSYEGTQWRFQTDFSTQNLDVNMLVTNIQSTINMTHITQTIDLEMLNNPTWMCDCDSDTYTDIWFTIKFHKFNNFKLCVRNTGTQNLTVNNATISPTEIFPNGGVLIIDSDYNSNILSSGKSMIIEMSCFNVIENGVSVPRVYYRRRLIDTEIPF